jgi:8-oxo-dGTP pyrophosphatase MutT (NUDIX family)/RimJ/RimL family protein N-acetyltransferase
LSNNFRKDGNLVYIKKPDFDELDYVEELWADEETMIDVGGCIVFPMERRNEWYKRMVNPTDDRNFYCLIYTKSGMPVGEVSFHRFDEVERKADFNIKIQNKFRGKGYGKEAMHLLLSYYFYDYSGQVIYDHVANEKGQKALRNFGFDIVSRSDNEILFSLTRDRFISLLSTKGLKHEKSCGAVIYRNNNKVTEFLLIKCKDSGYWGFPKGHVEESENEAETALREVYEETGLNIEIVEGFREETEFCISTNILKKVVFFIGRTHDTTVHIQAEEIDDYRWAEYEGASWLMTFDSDKRILKAVSEFLKKSNEHLF